MSERNQDDMIEQQATYENSPVAGYTGEQTERQELVGQWNVLSDLLTKSDMIRAQLAMPVEREEAIKGLSSLVANLPADAVPENWQEDNPEEVLELLQRYIQSAAEQIEQVIASLGN